ncbi:hypothetical protein [Cochleicola gelatinilyticus]|uniref:Uncharacterized protein n=1 Tax=Cochleicola gelatinilyticus TaxID=1763537 RepID=A0A167J768_9FLAO|nr:hypothetical protein [Cochleicola gelatinilyticus]OAB80391.1 hypothetical protein ULVI_06560 [Cochleicola gelatinilyticus]
MKPFFVLLICFAQPFINIAQNKFLTVPNDLKKGSRIVKEVFTVANKNNGDFALFIDDNKTLNGYLYNKNKERIGAYASDGLPNKYDEIIGKIIEGKKIILFLKDRNEKKFGYVLYDFDKNTSKEVELDLKLKKERFLQVINAPDRSYVITVSKKGSLLKLYEFAIDGTYTPHIIDLSATIFKDKYGNPSNLYDAMSSPAGFSSFLSAVNISYETPTTIETASETNKIFENENGFILTLDASPTETYIISVDFKNMDASTNIFLTPQLPANFSTNSPKSNSFLFNDLLFQITGSNDAMIVTTKKVETKEVVKRLMVTKEDTISFKNTPIIQEGSGFGPKLRNLEKTSKFLRKISTQKIGLAVREVENDIYHITIGGIVQHNNTAPMMMGGMGGLAGATIGAAAVSFNPTYFAYNSYTTTKSTRIESLFDTSFAHVPGSIETNVFDKIQLYVKESHMPKKAETIFPYKDSYIYGTYYWQEDKYELIEFPK